MSRCSRTHLVAASTDSSRLISSVLFSFYAGEEKRYFTVHSKTVTAISEPFERVINGNMTEAQERSAELPDVDPDTFQRFLKYAYRGGYKIRSYDEIKVNCSIIPTKPKEDVYAHRYPIHDVIVNYSTTPARPEPSAYSSREIPIPNKTSLPYF
jgi:hypothetical protein